MEKKDVDAVADRLLQVKKDFHESLLKSSNTDTKSSTMDATYRVNYNMDKTQKPLLVRYQPGDTVAEKLTTDPTFSMLVQFAQRPAAEFETVLESSTDLPSVVVRGPRTDSADLPSESVTCLLLPFLESRLTANAFSKPGVYVVHIDGQSDVSRRSPWTVSKPIDTDTAMSRLELDKLYGLDVSKHIDSVVHQQQACLVVYKAVNVEGYDSCGITSIECLSLNKAMDVADAKIPSAKSKSNIPTGIQAGAGAASLLPVMTNGPTGAASLLPVTDATDGRNLAAIAGPKLVLARRDLLKQYPHFEWVVQCDSARWNQIQQAALRCLTDTPFPPDAKQAQDAQKMEQVSLKEMLSHLIRAPVPYQVLCEVRRWMVLHKSLTVEAACSIAQKYLVPPTASKHDDGSSAKPTAASAPTNVVQTFARQLVEFVNELVRLAATQQYQFLLIQPLTKAASDLTPGNPFATWMVMEVGMWKCLYTHPCGACLKPGCLKHCAKCGFVYYCSAECQKAHWLSEHSKTCKTIDPSIFAMAHNLLLQDYPPITFDPRALTHSPSTADVQTADVKQTTAAATQATSKPVFAVPIPRPKSKLKQSNVKASSAATSFSTAGPHKMDDSVSVNPYGNPQSYCDPLAVAHKMDDSTLLNSFSTPPPVMAKAPTSLAPLLPASTGMAEWKLSNSTLTSGIQWCADSDTVKFQRNVEGVLWIDGGVAKAMLHLNEYPPYMTRAQFECMTKESNKWPSIPDVCRAILGMFPFPYSVPRSENVALECLGRFESRPFVLWVPVDGLQVSIWFDHASQSKLDVSIWLTRLTRALLTDLASPSVSPLPSLPASFTRRFTNRDT